MSAYNRNICEVCGGDHVTRQCPDREAGSSFAAPAGISPLPCPFCGNQPHDDCDPVARRVSCATAGCAIAFFGATIEAWNKRAGE